MKRQNHANIKSRAAAARVRLLAVGYETPQLMRMSYFQLDTLVRQNADAIARHEEKIRILRERTERSSDRHLAHQAEQRMAEELRLERISRPLPPILSGKAITIATVRQLLAKAKRAFVEHGGLERGEEAQYWQMELRKMEGAK